MASSFTRCGQHPRRVRSFSLVSSVCALVVLFGPARSGPFAPAVYAQQSRTVKQGVYTATQAKGAKRLTRTGAPPVMARRSRRGRTRLARRRVRRRVGQTASVRSRQQIQILMPGEHPGPAHRPQAVDWSPTCCRSAGSPLGRPNSARTEAVLKQLPFRDAAGVLTERRRRRPARSAISIKWMRGIPAFRARI